VGGACRAGDDVEGESVAKVEEVRLCPVFRIRFLLLLVSVCVV
jgi:hypothetical protein